MIQELFVFNTSWIGPVLTNVSATPGYDIGGAVSGVLTFNEFLGNLPIGGWADTALHREQAELKSGGAQRDQKIYGICAHRAQAVRPKLKCQHNVGPRQYLLCTGQNAPFRTLCIRFHKIDIEVELTSESVEC